ncbi:MAG: multidrug efflux system outer membrane protein [Myxococcota bacterium]|jgi:multidrug efflux system outer membrane protein
MARPFISECSLTWAALLLCLAAPHPAHAGRGDREAAALSSIPTQFSGVAPDGTVSSERWWVDFGVAELDEIIAAGLAANPDVMTAQRQLAQAQALAAQGLAPLLPTLSLAASLNGQPSEALTFNFDFPTAEETPDFIWTGSAGLRAGWNIDLWGANLLNFLAGRQDALASAASAESRRLTVSTSIANAWFDVVFHQARVDVISEQLVLAESLLELTELRYERGDSNALSVLQQRQQLQSTRALLPQSRSFLRIAQMQLAVLLGRSPSAAPTVLVSTMPELPAVPAVGDPRDLLERAPAVQAASAQLDAAEYRQRAAVRAVLPQLSLSGSVGPQYRYQSDGLLPADWEADVKSESFWAAGGQLSLPIFNGGSAYNVYRAAIANADAARYSLESAALAAVQQVEGALVLEEERVLQREAVEAQLEASRLTLDAAREQYQTGQTNFLPVLTAQQTLLQAELSALQAHRDQLSARIQLYTALGAATDGQGSAQ